MASRIASSLALSILVIVFTGSMTGSASAQDAQKGGVAPPIVYDDSSMKCQLAPGINACAKVDVNTGLSRVIIYAGRNKYTGSRQWRTCPARLCGTMSARIYGGKGFAITVRASSRSQVVAGELITRTYDEQGNELIEIEDLMEMAARSYRSLSFSYMSPFISLIRAYFGLRVAGVRMPLR